MSIPPSLVIRISRLSPRVKRYLVIGICVYLFEVLVIIASQALGASSLLAVGLAFWLGLTASFILQKLVTFGDKRFHYKIILTQVIAFSLLVLFNFGFTLLLTGMLDSVLPAVACRTLALGITTIWNFYLYKTRIFAREPAKGRKSPSLLKRAGKLKKEYIKKYHKWRRKPSVKTWKKSLERPATARTYLLLSIVILLGTTVLWSLLGAHLQQNNADQLVNPYLFDSHAVLKNAVFPDQHVFLVKWPLFYAIKLLGYSAASYIFVTAAASLATVAAFLFILSRFERRPLVLGTICLMLASVLLLVPPQPYAGALLPVNMAILATRNLEYVLYLAGLACIAGSKRIFSSRFSGGVGLLALVAASDKLFLSASVAGALVAMLCYSLRQRWKLVSQSALWLTASVAAFTGALMAAAIINHARIASVVGAQGGPYGLVTSLKHFVLGLIYGVAGLLTNFGANPAYDALTLRQIPSKTAGHLLSISGPAYLINLLVFLICIFFAARFLLVTLNIPKKKLVKVSEINGLAVLLLWSSIALMILFVGSDHYYQVDARYLTLWLFALFTALAAWLRPRRVDTELGVVVVPLLLVSIVCGVFGSMHTYNTQKDALQEVNHRNQVVAQTIASRHVGLLVGDYWRVMPIKAMSQGSRQEVLPLGSCDQPRNVLTSKAWQPDLHRTGFAYLLTINGSLTDYPNCSLKQVVEAYGLPNSSALINGSLAHPKELLLFYDRGIHIPASPPSGNKLPGTISPINLEDLTRTTCTVPSVMNIVAHEDDDLLFTSPDLINDINEGHCVRSVYLTAGDAGAGRSYWLSREQGSEAAYSQMTGLDAVWIHRIIMLPDRQFVTIANPRGNDRVSLIFMHLPDGNLDGQGFGGSDHQSLAKLDTGKISRLGTVDGQSSYTGDQLVNGIEALMHAYQPSAIRTQSNFAGEQYRDHSDHLAAGRFAARAYSQYEDSQYGGEVVIPLTFYMGYPIHGLPANVDGEALGAKQAAFSAYAQFDPGVCHSMEDCEYNSIYGVYLSRQYQNAY